MYLDKTQAFFDKTVLSFYVEILYSAWRHPPIAAMPNCKV